MFLPFNLTVFAIGALPVQTWIETGTLLSTLQQQFEGMAHVTHPTHSENLSNCVARVKLEANARI